jgi:NADH-quinone oxidoreductase subunit N
MMFLILIESSYGKKDKGRGLLFSAGVIGLVFATATLFGQLGNKPLSIFTDSMVIDSFATLMKIVMCLGTLAAIYIANQSKDIYQVLKPEFVIISVGVLIGGMILVSANNMLMLYIGVETLSILSYAMASLKKDDEKSSEAGLKYVLYGGIASGFMLFGMSHIFGVLGTIQFGEIPALLTSSDMTTYSILVPSFLLFFAGIGYKIACVPFHMWSPDVYEGSPLPVTTFFSIVPKVAGIGALIRISMVFFGNGNDMQIPWVALLTLVSALTMSVGNIAAIGQRSVKRMLAYSSISHAGFMMLGVVVLSDEGIRSVLFYAITYLFMTAGTFFIISYVQDKYGNDHFDRFKGLMYKHPVMCIAMAIMMFSLAGIPPLSGFVAKFNILSAVIAKKYYALAIIAGLNSVISVYYYLKIVRLMIFAKQESEDKIQGFTFVNQTIIVAVTVPVVILGIFWSKIIHIADGAKIFIQ